MNYQYVHIVEPKHITNRDLLSYYKVCGIHAEVLTQILFVRCKIG